ENMANTLSIFLPELPCTESLQMLRTAGTMRQSKLVAKLRLMIPRMPKAYTRKLRSLKLDVLARNELRPAPCSYNPTRRCSAMRTVSFSLLMSGLLVYLVVFPYGADAQGRTVQDCRNNVADALGMNASNVQANMGPDGENGNPVVEWEANLAGRRIRGFCQTSRNGQVIDTQLGVPRGGGGVGGGLWGKKKRGGVRAKSLGGGGFDAGGG